MEKWPMQDEDTFSTRNTPADNFSFLSLILT